MLEAGPFSVLANKLGTLIQLWPFIIDPILFSSLTDVISTVTSSQAPGAYQAIASQALPNVTQALIQAQSQPTEGWLASSAIEIITSVLRGAPDGAIGDGFFAMLAPSLFEILRVSEDREVSVVCSLLPDAWRRYRRD
jgi:importin-9